MEQGCSGWATIAAIQPGPLAGLEECEICIVGAAALAAGPPQHLPGSCLSARSELHINRAKTNGANLSGPTPNAVSEGSQKASSPQSRPAREIDCGSSIFDEEEQNKAMHFFLSLVPA